MSCKKHPDNPLCLCALSSSLDQDASSEQHHTTSARRHHIQIQRKRRRHDSWDCSAVGSISGRHHDSRMTQSAIFTSGLHISGRICKKKITVSVDDTVLASASYRCKKRPHQNNKTSVKPVRSLTSYVDVGARRHSSLVGPAKRKRRSRSLSAVQPQCVSDVVGVELSRSVSFKSSEESNCRLFNPHDLHTLDTIGTGFFGEVFKVLDRVSGDVLVMKRLKMDRINQATKCNFLKEATVMRNLDHYNLLKFLGVMFVDNQLHIISEYIGGGPLAQMLTQPMAWSRKISIARDIACGMTYLHSMNVIHRDLNCENVLVRSEDGSAVVADFGLSRLMTYPKGSRKRRYTVVGHPYSMAPEMMKETDYDERVDIFSFGICLCQMIVGCDTADPTLHIPRTEDIGVDVDKLMLSVPHSCPSSLIALALKCATVQPEMRPAFSVCLDELTCLLDGETTHDDCPSPQSDNCRRQVDRYWTNSMDNLDRHLSAIEESMDSPCSSLPPRKTSFSEYGVSGAAGNALGLDSYSNFDAQVKPFLLNSDTQDSGNFSSGGSLP